MNADYGAEWVAFAARRPVDEVRALLSDDQLVVLGKWLSENKLLNPPKNVQWKEGTFVCRCGCGETFTAKYLAKKPQYKNEAHRKRYWRARWRKEGRDIKW